MRRLFTLDFRDYDENWRHDLRPTVRGIIKNRYDDHGPENGGIWLERENFLLEMLMFEKKLAKEPVDIKDGIYYFDAHDHGDWFGEEDAAEWDNGRLESNWKKCKFLENPTTKKLTETIVANGKEVIDLASGPGMGLIPSIKQLDPAFHCTATDANAMVLEHWKRYLDRHCMTHGVGFAIL